jgi:hypothetical protein
MTDNNLCFDPLEGISTRSLDLLKNPLFWVYFNPEETISKRVYRNRKGGKNPSLRSLNRAKEKGQLGCILNP